MTKVLIPLLTAFSVHLWAIPAGAEPPANGRHLFILSGQSNMRQPLPDAFKASVEKVFGKDQVIVVTLAHPSQPIKRWYKNWTPPETAIQTKENDKDPKPETNGTLYDGLLKSIERSVKEQPLASVTYIWMQGEADAGSGWGSVYEKSFYGVLDQFKKDLNVKEINYVVGRINDHWLTEKGIKDGDLVRSIQVKMGEANTNGAWVNTDDLNTGVNPWGIYEIDGGHFPTPAYKVLGQRFAHKACKLIDPDIKLDDNFFDSVFLDTIEEVESHLAIGKKLSSTTTDANAKDLSALLDGKYASADHQDKNWIVFPPGKEAIELIVDLGESHSVTGIGVDLLIDNKVEADFPKGVVISLSNDGTTYQPAHNKGIRFFYKDSIRKEAVGKLKPMSLLMFIEFPEKPARYINIVMERNPSRTLLDEIIVNPAAKSDLARHAGQW